MFKKIVKSLLSGNSGNKRHTYSSSSVKRYSKKHNYYGHKHYKKGYKRSSYSSRSFFSS
ncbi:MAG: hypothetical protein ACI35R_01765 [Bacillus sp. (in: firmicutes)]